MNAIADFQGIKELERLKYLLEDWARWMSNYAPKLGYAPRAAVCASGAINSDFDELCEQADSHVYRSIEAAVDDLPPAKRAAINHAYCAAVWRFPRGNYAELLASAHVDLIPALRKRGVVV